MNGKGQMSNTLDYYNKNAKEYFDNTVDADMSDCYQKFLKYLPEGAYILDAGCGSGRDSKYFLSLGYRVKAIDGSKKMCELASDYLGQEVENVNFNDIDYDQEFDGIWACASLLHVYKDDIGSVILKMRNALRDEGVMHASFKYGDSDRISNERYFNDQNEDTIRELFKNFSIEEVWLSEDVRTDRTDKWVNVIVKKI